MIKKPKLKPRASAGLGLVGGLLLAASSQVQGQIDNGLVAYWPLDELQGDATPDIVSSYDMVAANLTPGDVVSGKFGSAFSFSNANSTILSRVHNPDDALPANKHEAFTVSMWVNVEGAGQNDLRLFSEGSTSSNDPLFNLGTHNSGADGRLDFYFRQSGWPTFGHAYSTGEPLDGSWHYITFVQEEDGTRKFYVDAVLDETPIDPKPDGDWTVDNTSIGGIQRAAASHFVTGLIDDVAIWSRAISESEINQIYADGAGKSIADLLVRETTIAIIGTGAESLIGGDLTDPEDDGDESGEDQTSGWNWVSIESNVEPGFGGGEFSYNIFDNAVGGGNDKWCCDDPTDDNPYWVAVQFANPVALTHFTITSGNDSPDRDPIRWAIQGSNDGQTYSDIFSYDEETSFFTDRNQVALINLAETSAPYSYLRYIVYHTPGTLHQINEIEYFGCFGGCGNPVMAGTERALDSFGVRVKDGSDNGLDTGSIQLTVDGAVVPHITSKSGDTTTILYIPDNKFPSLSSHTWDLSAADTAGNPIRGSGSWTTARYGLLTANHKVDADTSKPGFMIEIHQNEGFQANNHQRAIDQLNGLLGENYADPFFYYAELGEGSPGSADLPVGYMGVITYETEGVINLNQDDGGNAGEFGNDSGIPGVPGFTDSTDGIAGRFTSYVELPAGEHTFIVNSDDGFFTSVGVPGDVFLSSVAGEFEGGRGAADTAFTIVVEEDGIYPITTVWYEGGGGANIEIKTEKADGTRVLLNDTDNDGFATYRATNDGTPAKVSNVSPAIGATGVAANADIEVTLIDGDVSVDTGSVSVSIDGQNADASVSKSDGVTTVSVARNDAWKAGQTVTGTLTFTAGGSTRTHDWSWTVEEYPTLTQSVTDLGSGIDSGFEFRIYQSDASRGNNTNAAEEQLAGLFDNGAENVADPAGGTESADAARPGIIFNIDGVINFDQEGAAQGVFRDSGDGSSTDRADGPIPGIPGLGANPTDNMSAEILTYIEFPEAGYYQMIFNSDDGFLVSETHGAGDDRGATLGLFNGGRGAADTVFGFAVPEPGVYPIRAIWYEGGGGANLEWSSMVGESRYLINDSDGNALKAFRTRDDSSVRNIEIAEPVAGGIVSVGLTEGGVVIEYTGTLKSSNSVTGPYEAVAGASGPSYTVNADQAQQFYIAD